MPMSTIRSDQHTYTQSSTSPDPLAMAFEEFVEWQRVQRAAGMSEQELIHWCLMWGRFRNGLPPDDEAP